MKTNDDREALTEDVRESYALTGEGLDFKRVYWERREQFDQWLADHLAAVVAGKDAEIERLRAERDVLDAGMRSLAGENVELMNRAREHAVAAQAVQHHRDDLAERAQAQGVPQSDAVGHTITRTVFTIAVLHRTDDADHLTGEHNFETAWSEANDGCAVGDIISAVSTQIPDADVPAALRELGNDGEFFDADLNPEADGL